MKYSSSQIEERTRSLNSPVGKFSYEKCILNNLLTCPKEQHEPDVLGVPIMSSLETDFFRHPKEPYCLSELLPYNMNQKTGAGLKTALKEYEMLLRSASEALGMLEKGDFEKFDALIGENACEIRAVWLSIIVNNDLIDASTLRAKLCDSQKRINTFLQERTIALLMLSGISFKDFFHKEQLSLFLTFEELFVISSFLLTEAKESLLNPNGTISLCGKERCNPKKIKRLGEISSHFADNLLSKLKKIIAAASVQFVRQMALKANDPNLASMLSDKFTILHNDHLLCTPMFWTYKSILTALEYEEIPLIVYAEFIEKDGEGYKVIDSDWLFFESDFSVSGDRILVLKEPKRINYDNIACIVQGVVLVEENRPVCKSEWKKTMLEFPIRTVILAAAADHRQYPNSKFDEKIQLLKDHEYEFHRLFAQSNGFAMNNPRTFFIRHVYASQIGAICSLKDKEESAIC